MDPVLDCPGLGHELEEQPRPAAGRRYQHGGIVLRVVDPDAAQPGQLGLVVRCDLVVIEGSGPEPGQRRGMSAIEHDVVNAGHGSTLPRINRIDTDHGRMHNRSHGGHPGTGAVDQRTAGGGQDDGGLGGLFRAEPGRDRSRLCGHRPAGHVLPGARVRPWPAPAEGRESRRRHHRLRRGRGAVRGGVGRHRSGAGCGCRPPAARRAHGVSPAGLRPGTGAPPGRSRDE